MQLHTCDEIWEKGGLYRQKANGNQIRTIENYTWQELVFKLECCIRKTKHSQYILPSSFTYNNKYTAAQYYLPTLDIVLAT